MAFRRRMTRRRPAAVRRRRAPMARRRGYRRKRTTISSLASATVRPDRLIVKLPYVDTLAFNDVNNYVTKTFNLNSIWDPDRSGVGHSVLGYGTWAQFYGKYRVYKVAYNITFSSAVVVNGPNPGQADYGYTVGLRASNGTGVTVVDSAFFEQPHTRKAMIGPWSGSSSKTMKGTLYLPMITGRPSVSYKSDNTYAANFGYNPTEFITLQLGALQANPALPCSLGVSVKLVYYVELFDATPLTIQNPDVELRGPDPNTDLDLKPTGYQPTPSS